MKKTITTLAIFSSLILAAQTKDKKVGIQIGGGLNQSYSDLGNGFFDFGKAKYGFVGANFGYYLNKSFDANLGGSYGETGYYTNDSTKLNMLGRMGQGQLALKYKFANGYILKETSKIMPYLYLGAGMSNFSDVNKDINKIKNGSFATANAGAGVSFQLAKNLYLTYNLGYIWHNTDQLDYITHKSNDQNLQHALTLGFNIGKPKDDDKDGIVNSLDKCPGTPSGITVDITGCPVDADKDGIADYLDNCPSVAGIVSLKGCPDSDGDGVSDNIDKCPTVKGLDALEGCPDLDGDGIADSNDSCPNEKGLASLNGCPDSDGDGVPDKDDSCPTVKGLANFAGCPDSDNDGTADNKDNCPTIAGLAENKGCPEIKISENDKAVFQKAMSGIQFETGKDVIKKSSYSILDNVVSVLKSNPTWNVEVQGHTDSQGDAVKNKTLSQNRANAVKKYLVNKGVTNNLKPAGFGLEKPIADNTTPAGRAKNRRVEFNVSYEK